MTTIDELGRRAAKAARGDAAHMAASRVESGLEQLRLDVPITVMSPRRRIDGRRWAMIGTAAALIAAAVVALVVNASDSGTDRLTPAAPSTELTTPSTTAVATTAAPSTTEAPSITTAPVVPSDGIAVSFDSLPPAYPAKVFVGMTDQAAVPYVAIGDSWIVTVDANAKTATLIDPFTPTNAPQPLPLDVQPTGSIAAGPGDVLYAVVQGDGAEMSLDAIALSGDQAGHVIASAPVSAVAFAEAPTGVLGHGPDGIIDRRTGETLLGYVDATGASVTLGRFAHPVSTVSGDLAKGDAVVDDPDGAHQWHVLMKRDPASPDPLTGEAPAAPSSHGGAVVWTDVAQDKRVVAVLAADGTGTWYSLADGWQVAASDLDGTILARFVNGTVELARLDPPQRIDFLNQPAAPHQRVAFAATLPTTLTTAPPCTAGDIDVAPTQDGAAGTVYGILNVRNKGDHPCSVAGVPDVAFLDDAGNVVQSTDPSLLDPSGPHPIVLERDSWAQSVIGPIASNVCGGNQSSNFRLTVGKDSIILQLAVGRPSDPTQCSPDAQQPTVPGALAPQPYAPIDANPPENSALDGVQMLLDAPKTVHPGDVLRYDVVMKGPFDLFDSDCPVYTETIENASAQLLLNCTDGAGIHVTGGEEVRFHIELPIPADAAPGQATLTWTPVEPAGTSVTATVTITP